jgi:perosamine synthetase
MAKKYQIAKPYITSREEAYVLKALRSGNLSIGPFVESFENAFAKKVGTKYACAVSSGTAGLHLALLASGIGQGDEVITSPLSFIASANAILYVGATPVFVDIDPKTYNLNPKEIEKKITKRTKAILPVHIFGQPADMSEIMRIVRKHKLRVIEDACESIGATHRGKKVGTFGESAVFAFYPNKQITTGEGGMIVTNNKKVDELCRSLRNQGRTPNMQWLDHAYLGYNYRMDEMSAALGLAQIEKLDLLLSKRKEIAARYTKALSPLSVSIEIPYTAPDATHTWFVYVVRIKNPRISRDKVISDLAKRGVQTKPYLPAIHLFEFYRELGHKKGDYPVTERTSESTLALPLYVGLTSSDITHISRLVRSVIKKHERSI